jgi:hypothetical protein
MEYMAHILALAGAAEPLVAQTDGNAIVQSCHGLSWRESPLAL